eukprot:m.85561 g.85561  ORF g.85561 m.85561 type:complete len:255 (-) comp19787_c0_seq1:312-1076(-)
MTMCRVVVALLVFAVAGARGATKPTLFGCGVDPYADSLDGLNLNIVTRACTSYTLTSSSGACAETSGPQLVKQFNISTQTREPTTPGSSMTVQLADVNGTWIGAGFLEVSPTRYTLDYECIAPHDLRVLPHTSCHCTADLLTYYGDTCEGTCLTSAQCSQFTKSVPCGGSVFQNATVECAENAANGCMLSSPSAPCAQIFNCEFNPGMITKESQWSVSCSFPVVGDPDNSVIAPSNVQCVGIYLEVGSNTSILG